LQLILVFGQYFQQTTSGFPNMHVTLVSAQTSWGF